MIQNPNCDGNHCLSETGEVRLLPLGARPDQGNLCVCHACYTWEIAYRTESNKRLGKEFQYKLPTWESLQISHPS